MEGDPQQKREDITVNFPKTKNMRGWDLLLLAGPCGDGVGC